MLRKRILFGAGGLAVFAFFFPLALDQMNVKYPFAISFIMFLVSLVGLGSFILQLPRISTLGKITKGTIALIVVLPAAGLLSPQFVSRYRQWRPVPTSDIRSSLPNTEPSNRQVVIQAQKFPTPDEIAEAVRRNQEAQTSKTPS